MKFCVCLNFLQRWNAGEWRERTGDSFFFETVSSICDQQSSESWNLSQTGLHSDVTRHLLETNIFVSDSAAVQVQDSDREVCQSTLS